MIILPKGWMSKLDIKDGEFTFLGSISQQRRVTDTERLICYNWDMYSWQDYKSGEWKEFGELCKQAIECWYPSECTQRQAEAIYGVKKGFVVKMYVPVDWLPEKTKDDNYVLVPMRHYDRDRQFDWAKRACEELRIPLKHPDHSLTEYQYKKVIANCTMILSPYYEASTGGMGMIEGVWLGKSVLACDSPLNGEKNT